MVIFGVGRKARWILFSFEFAQGGLFGVICGCNYCLMSDVAIWAMLPYERCCHMSDVAILVILPYVRCCHMCYVALCAMLPYLWYCHMCDVALCAMLPYERCCICMMLPYVRCCHMCDVAICIYVDVAMCGKISERNICFPKIVNCFFGGEK